MNTIKITTEIAIKMFLNYNKELSASGVSFSNMTYMTDEAKSKIINKKKALQKLVNTNATIGSDYSAKGNRILDKEGTPIDFVSQPMKGKEYVKDGMPVCIDTKTRTKYYLVYIVENHTKPQVQLYLNNNPVERKDVWNSEYITPSGLNPKPQIACRGLISEENNFFFRTLNFDNLRSFKMNGNLYAIEN